MDWESEEAKEMKEAKDTPKRVWYGILLAIVVMTGVVFFQEGQQTTRNVGVHAKHILVGVSAGNVEMHAAAIVRVKDIKRQLDEGGNFSALAAQYSDDPSSKKTGGDLGWIAKGEMTKGFDEYLWKGPVGEYSDPVETSFGFHIIYILERNLSSAEEYQNSVNERLNERNRQAQ